MKAKRIFCMMLCFMMLLSAVSFGVSARETELANTGESAVYYIETYEQLMNHAAVAQAGFRYILNNDIFQDDNLNNMEVVISSGAEFNLDLNGYNIQRSTTGNDSALFRIKSDGRMTIKDTSASKTGVCSFSEGYSSYYKAVFYNEGGELEIYNGYYQIFSPYEQGECSVVRTVSGYTNIYDGTFDSSESWGGDTISVGHNAYLYDVPHVNIFGGEFYGKYQNVDISPFDNYLSYGRLFPTVYVLGGNFYVTKDSDSSGFAYCNNGWGRVLVAAGTVPAKCLNSSDQRFLNGTSKKLISQTIDDYTTAYYQVTAPAMLMTDNMDYYYRLIGLCDKEIVRSYGKSVYEAYKDDFDEIMNRIDTVVIASENNTPPTIVLRNRTTDHIYVNWYMTEDSYIDNYTEWTHIGDAYGVSAWQPSERPADGGSCFVSCVVTSSDLGTYEDTIRIVYEPVKSETVVSYVEVIGVDTPVAGMAPDYDALCITEGCNVTAVEWYDVTEGKGVLMTQDEMFKAGRSYRVVVKVEAEENYIYETDDIGANVAAGSICGLKAIAYSSYDNSYLELGYNFEPCEGEVTIGVLCDANEDGEINIKDATLIQKYTASLETISEIGLILADADGDGDVNIKDATAIQKHIAGIDTGLDIGKEIVIS